MAKPLTQGAWDGDRDSLGTPPEPEARSPVAAEGASCAGRHCLLSSASACITTGAKDLVGAQVIANHDLLFRHWARGAARTGQLPAGAGRSPPPARHRLVTICLQRQPQPPGLIDRLASRALRIGTLVEVTEVADIPGTPAHCARPCKTSSVW